MFFYFNFDKYIVKYYFIIYYFSELVLDQLVHFQHNNQKAYYFLEIDVHLKNESNKIYRSTHFVRYTKEKGVCFVKEWDNWKSNVEINLLTPIKNQKCWLEFMIHMLENLMKKNLENNVRTFLY